MRKDPKTLQQHKLVPVKRAVAPPARRAVVSQHIDDDQRRRLLAQFARALLPQPTTPVHRQVAAPEVAAGNTTSIEAARAAKASNASSFGGNPAPLASVAAALQQRIDGLPKRQRQTLDGLLAGESEKQIAFRLKLSHHTVHDHVKRLHRTLGVSSRGELLSLFIRHP
jgi:DNA-binding NarL/FixJ family response regulator